MTRVCLLLLASVTVTSSIGVGTVLDWVGGARDQSVRVTGKLTCNGAPAEKVKVKLYEDEAVLDVLLDERFTDETGSFEVNGTKSERSWIEPKVNIYHRCNYDGNCVRKISIEVPVDYVKIGDAVERTFDIGTLNLAAHFSGETNDCIN